MPLTRRMHASLVDRTKQLSFGFVLADNFTLTAFSAFLDVLRLAADDGDGSRPIACAWQLMGPGRRPIRASCGIEVQPTSDLIDPKQFDFIVVVGGLLHNQDEDSHLPRYLKNAAKAGVTLIGLCTGSFILCRLGLMNGRRCCVSWYHYQDFLECFPGTVPIADRLFVIDGDRITCAGGAGVADLAAHLVSSHLGASRALKALNILLIPRPRSGGDAQPAPPLALGTLNTPVSRALLIMEQNLANPIPITEIAKKLRLGIRQLERIFHLETGRSPQKAYLEIRLKHARWMLGNTSVRISDVATDLGFSDGAHLTRSFKHLFGRVPSEFRADEEVSSRNKVPYIERRAYD